MRPPAHALTRGNGPLRSHALPARTDAHVRKVEEAALRFQTRPALAGPTAAARRDVPLVHWFGV